MSLYPFPAHKSSVAVLDDVRTERAESTHQRVMWSIPGRQWRLEHRLDDAGAAALRDFYMGHRLQRFEYEGREVAFADVPTFEALGGGWWSCKVELVA